MNFAEVGLLFHFFKILVFAGIDAEFNVYLVQHLQHFGDFAFGADIDLEFYLLSDLFDSALTILIDQHRYGKNNGKKMETAISSVAYGNGSKGLTPGINPVLQPIHNAKNRMQISRNSMLPKELIIKTASLSVRVLVKLVKILSRQYHCWLPALFP